MSAAFAVAPLVAVVMGLAVPFVFMRMIAPALAGGRTARNYRGTEVYLGLGVVWLVWAGGATIAGIASVATGQAGVLRVFALAGPLALVTFALGLVDDALGTSADRGFRGHFKALAHGRMTTGMLKLVGVGVVALAVGLVVAKYAPWGLDGVGPTAAEKVRPVIGAVLAAASIALTSNFINLMDLRPGRALKVYSVLALAGAAVAGMALARLQAGGTASAAEYASSVLTVSIMLLGPVVAVWRFDLGEQGMLGDAGANPMGAVAGFVIALGLPLWGVAAYAVAMLALNLASERYSFSRVIEGNTTLSRLDALGRPGETAPTADSSKSSPDSGPSRE